MGRRTTNLPPHVRRHRGGFRAVFRIGGEQHRSGTYETPGEAAAYVVAVKRAARAGADKVPTLARAWALLDDDIASSGVAAGTADFYRKQRGIVAREFADDLLLDEVTPERLRAYAAKRIGAGVAARTAWHKELLVLGRALECARRDGLIATNPYRDCRKPPNRQRGYRMLTVDQLDEVLATIRASGLANAARDAAVVELSFGCGLRRAELARLRRQDVDLRAGRLFVAGKTGDSYLPIHDRVRPALETLLAGDSDPLIGGEKMIERLFLRWSKRLGLERRFSPQVLRHSTASALARGGARDWVVKEAMRHRDLRTTQRYVHEMPDLVPRALDALRPGRSSSAPPAEQAPPSTAPR